jgi:hypothetical protein
MKRILVKNDQRRNGVLLERVLPQDLSSAHLIVIFSSAGGKKNEVTI